MCKYIIKSKLIRNGKWRAYFEGTTDAFESSVYEDRLFNKKEEADKFSLDILNEFDIEKSDITVL